MKIFRRKPKATANHASASVPLTNGVLAVSFPKELTIDDERERFEKWAKQYVIVTRLENGGYVWQAAVLCWQAWQAAKADAKEEAKR